MKYTVISKKVEIKKGGSFLYMKEYKIISKFKFWSLSEIKDALENSEYKDYYFLMETNIPNESAFTRPSDEFERELGGKKIKYFAYIKFFQDNAQIFGIVAGKTGSSLVNIKSDICFSTNVEHGFSRLFLEEQNLTWYKEFILIVRPKEFNDKNENRKEALAIERDLKRRFSLLGS